MKKTIIFGADPGKSGCIAAYDGSDFKFYHMPESDFPTGKLLKSGKPQLKKGFDEGGFRQLTLDISKDYKDFKRVWAIEKVHGRNTWSAQATFNFGYVSGLLRSVPIMLGDEYEEVTPKKWQSEVRKGYPEFKKSSSTGKAQVIGSKAIAEHIVLKEFPNTSFKKTERSKINHDGAIDAALIALYLYRTLNK